MRVILRRTLGIIAAEETVEVVIETLPLPLLHFLEHRYQRNTGSGDLPNNIPDKSNLRVSINYQPFVPIDESQCEPDLLDALDDLWDQGLRTRAL